MSYQIKVWFNKNFISFDKAVYELRLIGFTEFAAEEYLYSE